MGLGRAVKVLRLVTGALGLILWIGPGGIMVALGAREAAIRAWSAIGLWALGVKARTAGRIPASGLLASNHISYIDIFILGRYAPGFFVAKGEIARWPFIGTAARLAGVVFIERDRARAAAAAIDRVASRLAEGARAILFPEGGIPGSVTGLAPVRPMFFEAAIKARSDVVPAFICYTSPADPSAWAWTDGSHPVGHVFNNLLPAPRVEAVLLFGEPIAPEPGEDRKALAGRYIARMAGLMEQAEAFCRK